REPGQEGHGHGVGLFSGGAARAPHAHAPRHAARVGARLPFREDAALEEIELPRLAGEMRLVRAAAVERAGPLLLVRFDPRVIGAEVELELAKAPGEPSLDQDALGVRELDPRLLVDEALEEPEVAEAERSGGAGCASPHAPSVVAEDAFAA